MDVFMSSPVDACLNGVCLELDLKSLLVFSSCSKFLRRNIVGSKTLWRLLLLRDFPLSENAYLTPDSPGIGSLSFLRTPSPYERYKLFLRSARSFEFSRTTDGIVEGPSVFLHKPRRWITDDPACYVTYFAGPAMYPQNLLTSRFILRVSDFVANNPYAHLNVILCHGLKLPTGWWYEPWVPVRGARARQPSAFTVTPPTNHEVISFNILPQKDREAFDVKFAVELGGRWLVNADLFGVPQGMYSRKFTPGPTLTAGHWYWMVSGYGVRVSLLYGSVSSETAPDLLTPEQIWPPIAV